MSLTVQPRLILASASPRRRELVGRLGVPYDVASVDVDETLLPGEAPATAAQRVAVQKARAAAAVLASGIVIGADTMVVLDGSVLGKPQCNQEAVEMLRALRGRQHQVITGLAILDVTNNQLQIDAQTTIVGMRNYSDEEIARYVASGDPLDKAGAYGIQNTDFHPAATVVGCYLNVVGLPLCMLSECLSRMGVAAERKSQRSGGWCRSCLGRTTVADTTSCT